VDGLGRLVGKITIDDVVDVIREEAGKDIQMMSGITGDVEVNDNVWSLSKVRIPWLFVGLAGCILGSRTIGTYENQIQIHPEMAFFIPLIATDTTHIISMTQNAALHATSLVFQLARVFLTGRTQEEGLPDAIVNTAEHMLNIHAPTIPRPDTV
jgi:Mg/Co/Ni transporter MgtE